MLPDIEAMSTMLPWTLFATMSFATALAVMKDPGVLISKWFPLQHGFST
jgi:hypothetical protein